MPSGGMPGGHAVLADEMPAAEDNAILLSIVFELGDGEFGFSANRADNRFNGETGS